MIYNLQLLRAVAALAVVYYHIATKAGLDLPVCFGKFGVDVFFVVSGFIIAYIGSNNPHSFLLRRLIRIVPFYWSATLFVFCIAWLTPQLLRQTRPDLPHLIFSLLFIPHETTYAGMFPTLLLGWTLNYEMYFYILFTVSLLLSPRFAPLICSLLLSLVVASIAFSGTENEMLKFYARPIVFEFVLGIVVYYVVNQAARCAALLRSVGWLKWALYFASIFAIVLLAVQEAYGGSGWPVVLASGLPAMVLVLCVIVIESIYGDRANNPLIFLMGESSFILYLIHPYVIYGTLRLILGPTNGLGVFPIVVLVLILMAVTAAIAVLIHVWFEKPIMSYIRRLLIRESSSSWKPSPIPLVLETGRTA